MSTVIQRLGCRDTYPKRLVKSYETPTYPSLGSHQGVSKTPIANDIVPRAASTTLRPTKIAGRAKPLFSSYWCNFSLVNTARASSIHASTPSSGEQICCLNVFARWHFGIDLYAFLQNAHKQCRLLAAPTLTVHVHNHGRIRLMVLTAAPCWLASGSFGRRLLQRQNCSAMSTL